MKNRTVSHGSFTIERTYPVSPERVFAAFSDPAKKRRWFADEEEAEIEDFKMDFRVGGFERKSFRAKNGWVFTNDTVYRDIVLNNRIVFAYNMSMSEKCFSSSLATVEFVADGKGTTLVFTEQGAFFEGADGPKMREEGWNLLLNNLAKGLEQ